MYFEGAPFERVLVVDMESAWCTKSGYTLSKITNEEYVRDPRFHAWGLCWKVLGAKGPAKWVAHDDIPDFLQLFDWTRTAVLAHNAAFDISIMSWVYGVLPCFVLDSLSVARALRGIEAGNSLAKLAEFYGLPAKGRALHSTDGILVGPLPVQIERELAEYCAHDVFLCESVFERLYEEGGPFPTKELRLIDMTLKMFLNPVLELDPKMLRRAIREELVKRGRLIQRLGINEKTLASNQQFAEVLIGLGIEPPMKKSKTTGKTTFAFAKNDAMFQALVNGPDENIALLCEARLKVKSTMERTRAQRFLDISRRGRLPVPLAYYGAHTGRWAALRGAAINMQNLKRGSFLRNAVLAPKGFSLVVGDLSQIEPRVLAWLVGYEALLDIFRAGGDPYATFGAQMFGIPGLNKDDHPVLRQSAKSALLGAGYGLGWASFAAQLLTGFLGAPPVLYDKKFAKQLGITAADVEKFLGWEENIKKMEAIPHTCTSEQLVIHCISARVIIDRYRATASPVKEFWGVCQALIERSLFGGEEVVYKCLTFRREEIVLPNGMSLRYPGLQKKLVRRGKKVDVEWTYGDNKKLYGGKITENVTQALARLVMTDGMLRVQKMYFVAGTVHDEQIALVPDSEVVNAEPWFRAQMVKPPSWMPDVPLAADVGSGKRYGECKK